ncbi:MAG: PilZ domain-containing protein [Vallitalea sp.]|nr:PilZ domain-containing protein [Vallitalea sp.]
MSIFFMTGRNIYRKYERTMISIPCTIEKGDFKINCLTRDISESGFSVMFDFPKYIDYKKEYTITLKTDRYISKFKSKIVHVDNIKRQWKFSFQISEIEEEEKKQLLQIIYDRKPSLPEVLDTDVSTFEDLKINTFKRIKKERMSNRRLSRFSIDESVEGVENLIIPLDYGITLNCKFVQTINNSHDKLYRIVNYEDIAQNDKFELILRKWIDSFDKSIKERMEKRLEIENNVPDEFDEMRYI